MKINENLVKNVLLNSFQFMELEKMDNKQLLWLLISSNIKDNIELFSFEDCLMMEIENRLYPEYDGENIYPTEKGWHTPNEEIEYK